MRECKGSSRVRIRLSQKIFRCECRRMRRVLDEPRPPKHHKLLMGLVPVLPYHGAPTMAGVIRYWSRGAHDW